jgi:hypothetical protein
MRPRSSASLTFHDQTRTSFKQKRALLERKARFE